MGEILMLSGGVDSSILAGLRQPSLCVTVDYGQRSAIAERFAADAICKSLGLQNEIVETSLDKKLITANEEIDVKGCMVDEEWIPFRNQFLATLGAMIATQRGYDRVLFGSSGGDEKYSDGTKKFFVRLNDLISAQEGSIIIEAPYAELDIVNAALTTSCDWRFLAFAYSCNFGNIPCYRCKSCRAAGEKLAKIFEEGR